MAHFIKIWFIFFFNRWFSLLLLSFGSFGTLFKLFLAVLWILVITYKINDARIQCIIAHNHMYVSECKKSIRIRSNAISFDSIQFNPIQSLPRISPTNKTIYIYNNNVEIVIVNVDKINNENEKQWSIESVGLHCELDGRMGERERERSEKTENQSK